MQRTPTQSSFYGMTPIESLSDPILFNTNRHVINDPLHYSSVFFSTDTVKAIQQETSRLLSTPQQRLTVSTEQIKNVMDSVYESNPRVGNDIMVKMCIDFIVSYITNERDVMNQASKYDISVQKYDGSFGMEAFPQGQIKLKNKGPNRFSFHMIY